MYRSCWIASRMRDWVRQRPLTSKALASFAIVLSIVVALRRAKIRPTTTTDINPFQALYDRNKDTKMQCQETIYQPFLVGCPADCHPYRGNRTDAKNATTMYYRLTLEFYLGQAKLALHLPRPQPNTFYDMGYNYQCSNEFVDAFGRASDHLEAALLEHKKQQYYNNNNNYSDLVVKTQARMHLSLAYMCCLTLEEAYHVREIMQEFVHNAATNTNFFNIPNVNFERIECWKERFNSITHIIVVDNASQRRLLNLLHVLEDAIRQAGIPVPISRLTQMPFHSTLLGVQLGNKYSTDPQHNIDPILPVSFQTLQDMNRNLWPKHGVSFDIRHLPKYSWRPELQAAIN